MLAKGRLPSFETCDVSALRISYLSKHFKLGSCLWPKCSSKVAQGLRVMQSTAMRRYDELREQVVISVRCPLQ